MPNKLLSPYTSDALRLPNRLVMAPMTRNRATAGGVPTELMARYYAQRATAGLIVAEAATPNAVGQTYPNITAIHNDAHVEGWRLVTGAVAAAGGRMFLQIEHGGRIGHPETSGLRPVAPSPIALPDTIHTPGGRSPSIVPKELTTAEVRATARDFVAAARRAIDAGFQGVEVHSANGYLLHQFLSANTNRRTDVYADRVRFPAEVVTAVAEAIGAHRVGLRISPENTDNGIAEGDPVPLYTGLLERIPGLAYLHVAYADPARPVFERIRRRWAGTLIANPRLPADHLPADGGRAAAERLLAEGADLVSLGRPFLANPDLVERLRRGAPINQVRDGFLYAGGAQGYTDYPALTTASSRTA